VVLAAGVLVAGWLIRQEAVESEDLQQVHSEGDSSFTAGSRPSFLLVSIDTLRADHMSLYGYSRPTTPNIDAWARDAVVFERAYATADSTAMSVTSMLTGMLPQDHGVRKLYQKIPIETPTVADRLSGVGYQTAAVVSNIVLTSEATGLDGRFDHYDDYIDETLGPRTFWERRASRTTDAALAWLVRRLDPGRPHFLWVHYMDPHGPYSPPEDQPTDFTHATPVPIVADRTPEYFMEPGITDAEEYVDRYDEEIAYADREVGRLLNGYAEIVGSDSSLIILTADHGEAMIDRERWFAHGFHIFEELTHVPLLLRGPGAEPRRIPHLVSVADVAPTLYKAAGLTYHSDSFGRPLDEAAAGRSVFSETDGGLYGRRAMWQGDDKWAVQVGYSRLRGAARKFLFRIGFRTQPRLSEAAFHDLAADPREQAPSPIAPTDLPAELHHLIEEDDNFWLDHEADGSQPDLPKVAPDLDAKALERLRSLGYVQ